MATGQSTERISLSNEVVNCNETDSEVTNYEEIRDPSDFRLFWLPEVPKNTFLCDMSLSDKHYHYNDMTLVNVPLARNQMYKILFPVNVCFQLVAENGTKSAIFIDLNPLDFYIIYNHSEMIRMKIHNTFLCNFACAEIDLPSDIFYDEEFVYVFIHPPYAEHYEMTDIDYVKMLECAVYLMVTEDLLCEILSCIKENTKWKTNTSILAACYYSDKLFGFPKVSKYLYERFCSDIECNFYSEILTDTFSNFKKRMKKYYRNSTRFHDSIKFYHWRFQANVCNGTCSKCEHDKSKIGVECNEPKHEPMPTYFGKGFSRGVGARRNLTRGQNTMKTPVPSLVHRCSSGCYAKSDENVQHPYHVNEIDERTFLFYENLNKNGKKEFSRVRRIHNNVTAKAYQILCQKLQFHYTPDYILHKIMPCLCLCSKMEVIGNSAPINYLLHRTDAPLNMAPFCSFIPSHGRHYASHLDFPQYDK